MPAEARTPREDPHRAQLQRWLQDANLELAGARKRQSEQVPAISTISKTSEHVSWLSSLA